MKELVSLRKPREKHFLNEDGTFTVQMYDHDIHYLENGEYKEIDNSLIELDSYIKSVKNSFGFRAAKNSPLVTVSQNEKYLTLKLVDFYPKKTEIRNNEIVYTNNNGLQIKYSLMAGVMKEAIIFENAQSVMDHFKFVVNTNLELVQNANQNIIVRDHDNTLFTLKKPYLIDAKRNVNSNVQYYLTKHENQYEIMIKLDEKWFKDGNITYPIILDPTIINGREENVYDVFLSSENPDKAYGTYHITTIGPDENGVGRALLKFTLPELDSSCSIVNATVYLSTLKELGLLNRAIRKVNVHEAISDWDEETATWNNNKDNYSSLVRATFYPTYSPDYSIPNEPVQSNFDLTQLVKEWYGGKENYGILLKYNNETYTEDCVNYTFYNKEYDLEYQTQYRPYLTISYRIQNGIENYMDYKQVAYSNGATYINNYNGNIVGIFSLNKTLSQKYPVQLNAIYNGAEAIKNENNAGLAIGWRLNFSETIIKETIDTENYLKYVGETGSIHYLISKTDTSFVDEDGLGLEVTYDNDKYLMKNAEGTRKEFTNYDNVYKLTKITNIAEDTITISYENGKIIKLVDADQQELTINYLDSEVQFVSGYETVKVALSNSHLQSISNKFGTTSFIYNTVHLVTKITDTNGLYNTYTYQTNAPYRVSEVKSFGKNNAVGPGFSYKYLADLTGIIENNITNFYLFDSQGRLVNQFGLPNDNNTSLSEVCGRAQEFLNRTDGSQNKLASATIPLRYVKNIFTNSSFEEALTECNFTVTNAQIALENASLGHKALKISNSSCTIEYNSMKTNDYTVSFDFKSLGDQEVLFELYRCLDTIETQLDSYTLSSIYNTKEYERISLTGSFTNGDKLKLKITQNNNTASSYLDNIQLETGKIANLYNLVNNSDFELGTSFWNVSSSKVPCYEIVDECNLAFDITISNKAIHLLGDSDGSASLSQHFTMPGVKGDLYHVSFWYKCMSVLESDGYFGNIINLQFPNVDPLMGGCTFNLPIQSNINEWQFFSSTFVAENDYDEFNLNFVTGFEPNGLYITNLMINKDLSQVYLNYDEEGNTTQITNPNGSKIFKYDSNNQLISEFNALGNNFKYEYDNEVKDRVLKGISPTGISNEIQYDDNGNPIKTFINNVNIDTKIISGHSYNIRLKGTSKYLMYDYVSNELKLSDNNCNYTIFKPIQNSDEYYKIYLHDLFLTATPESVYFTSVMNDNCLFKINKLDNGSYFLKVKAEPSKILVFENENMFLKEIDQTTVDLNTMNESQFYFEDISTNLFIESEAKYDETGRFINELKDSLGKTKKFNHNSITGLTEKSIDANGTETNYSYNTKEQIESINTLGKEITYTYNTDDLLNTIHVDNKTYACTYDDFLNIKSIMLNNKILITKEYDNVIKRLKKTTYANGKINEYNYDKFNRLSKYTKGNKNYLYEYNNLNLLAQIKSDTEFYKYGYDYANRLVRFTSLNHSIKYTYNDNNNILSKTLFYNGNKYDINYEYDANDNIIKMSYGDNDLTIQYDYLGRINQKNIKGNTTEYSYITNGLKTSCIISELKINNDIYKYIYDDLYNITKIFKNDKLAYEYSYNTNNHLEQEINHIYNRKFKYIYNDQFNLMKKQTLTTYDEFLTEETYEYTNEDWEDQLTKYNNIPITYDELGNIKAIGNTVFKWEDARELAEITNDDSSIKYTYNIDGIRTKKEVNKIVTEYILDGKNVIIEDRNGSVIYYIRDNIGDPIGLSYLNQEYYFIKNLQGDVIGLSDAENNLIASYEYDAWGNILVILDPTGTEITDPTNIAIINPFRYRSYYYDEETKMYYLGHRYYAPKLHRFISIDSSIYTNISSKNLYIYCGNNPVTRKDMEGSFFFRTIVWGGIGGIISAASKMISNAREGNNLFEGTLTSFAEGFVDGALIASGVTLTPVGSVVKDAIFNTAEEVTPYITGEKDVTLANVIDSTANVAINTTLDKYSSSFSDIMVGIDLRGRRPERILTVLTGKQTRKYTLKTFLETAYSDLFTLPFDLAMGSETTVKQLGELVILE